MTRLEREQRAYVKDLLKSELRRRRVPYKRLAWLLGMPGHPYQAARVLNNKISRGGFSAVFFFQVMKAIRADHLDLSA